VAADEARAFAQHEAAEFRGDGRKPAVAAVHDVPLAHDGKSLDGDDGEAAQRELVLDGVCGQES
jgi:hypothetical protein